MKINNIAIVGAGAVGTALGSVMYEKLGNRFSYIATGKRETKIKEKGLLINGQKFYPEVTSDMHPRKLDFVILCVKNYSLDSAIEDLYKIIDRDTVIMPLLNGVTAVSRLKEAFPFNPVLYGIIMRTDANRTDKNVTYSTLGEIQYGTRKEDDYPELLKAISTLFEEARINANVYENMEYMQWRKWLVNVGSNQVSVLTEAQFKYFGQFKEIVYLMRDAMQEIVEISKKLGTGLTEQDRGEIEEILINYPPEKKTSMLQDLEAKRKTEIDYFAGTVIKLGKETGVPTPVNQTLYYAIKAREKVYLAEKSILEERENNGSSKK